MNRRWHFKKENTPESKMLCGSDAQMNGGTARLTTTCKESFMRNPCKNCLSKLKIKISKQTSL